MTLSGARFGEAFAFACLMAIAAFVPVMLNADMHLSVVISKVTFAQPMACLGLGAVLAAGAASWRELAGTARWAILAFVAFLAVAIASAALEGHWMEALGGAHGYREGLATWTAYGFFFAALLLLVRDRADRAQAFLDVMLLASVAPLAYGFMQVAGLQVLVHVALADVRVRPDSTLGNSLWFAGYLALLAPLAAMRAWLARVRPAEAAVWAALAALQLIMLWLTQSRGPLIACVVAAMLIAGLVAAWRRSRALLAASAGGALVIVLLVAAINVVPPLRDAVKPLPTVGRLVMGFEGLKGEVLSGEMSAAVRLGLWEAGTKLLLESPPGQLLLGHGPELAWQHHSRHLPPLVVQVDGYEDFNRYPRLHADILDIALNYGLVGWLLYVSLFFAALHAALRALFGLSVIGSLSGLAIASLAGGTLAGALAGAAGLPTATVPAFGLGMAGGWCLWIALLCWRAIRRDGSAGAEPGRDAWLLLAALTASLVAFWVDAQVNNPVVSTRFVSFTIMALVFCMAAHVSKRGLMDGSRDESPVPDDPSLASAMLLPAVAFCVLAAVAAFIPSTVFVAADPQAELSRGLRRILPGAAVAAFGLGLLLARGAPLRQGRWMHAWLLLLAGVPLAHAVLLRLCAANIGAVPEPEHAVRIALLALLPLASALLVTLIWSVGFAGRIDPRASAGASSVPRTALQGVVMALAVMLAGVATWLGHDAGRASVEFTLSNQAAAAGKRAEAVRFRERAVAAEPHARQYRQDLVQMWLGIAVAGLPRLGEGPAVWREVDAALSAAEARARILAGAYPDDPAAQLQLANVLQVRGLRALRSLTGEAGAAAAAEARERFAAARALFPAQPLVLRQWAQLEFDQQRYADAALLLDLMEGLIPEWIDAYRERIGMAQQLGDRSTMEETLERAAGQLGPGGLERLRAVAKTQQ